MYLLQFKECCVTNTNSLRVTTHHLLIKTPWSSSRCVSTTSSMTHLLLKPRHIWSWWRQLFSYDCYKMTMWTLVRRFFRRSTQILLLWKKVSDPHIFPSYSYSVSVYVALGRLIVEVICSASHFSCYLQVHAVDLLLRLRQILNKHKKNPHHEKTAKSNNRQCGVFRWTQMKYFETSVLSAKEVKMQSKQTYTRSLTLTLVARGNRLCPFRTNMLNNSVVA